MQRILVGTDFSPEADQALTTATAFARGKGAALPTTANLLVVPGAG